MKRFLTLLVLPVLGILIVLAGLNWSRRELRLRFEGTGTNGRIVGMVLNRGSHADLVTGIDTNLQFSLANGDRVDANYSDYAPVSATYVPENGQPWKIPEADLDPKAEKVPSGLSKELRRALNESVSGDATIIRWALKRESRREKDTTRIIRIAKTETVHGYFGLPQVPETLKMHGGRVAVDQASAVPSTARIQAVFDFSDPVRVKENKGETLISYAYERPGGTAPENKNFFLYAEPYATEFRPVFAFSCKDNPTKGTADQYARLSHIGRHGGPTLALRLFDICKVYYDPQQPAEAVLMADPGPPPSGAWLNWFSRFCEGLFAQWGTSALMILAGSMFLAVGLMFIWLALSPSKQAPPDHPHETPQPARANKA